MTRLAADWLESAAAQAVCAMLTGAGHQAWFVGGCVRNALIGAPVADLDISTDAWPDRVMALAEAAGLRAVPTGIDHGTVTVIAEGAPFEITTFRRDVETDGRHAVVAFADTMEEDAARRDFTMNALYAGPDGAVVDPLGGLPDLAARHVRFIGSAEDRIREDYLRILRFFRFHAWYGDADGGLDPDGLAACAELADGIDGLSRERIGHEMLKLLAAPDPAPSVAAMEISGVLLRVLPGAASGALTVLVHAEGAAGLRPDPIRRLAALGGEGAKAGLRLSRADEKRLARLSEAMGDAAGAGELGYRLGADEALDVLALRGACVGAEIDPVSAESARHGAVQTLPIKPTDLQATHSGKALGAALKAAERRWIDSGFVLTRDQLLS
ncbi:CCA tRNA nucleotidyltransferase [Roseisalinus antarcticus]|uniref:CCA-adding enzyme n=1 Tax=Roseisalinus antarcticus TaxID=254357 RepID=A0A1Y5S8T0_9RHOB|nr:CCA tRNA nucleotidyltransferase [Roseisalinus antarcticus]SLN32693.1 CCA-adding enzyme [Roseisalinus antarcticus]